MCMVQVTGGSEKWTAAGGTAVKYVWSYKWLFWRDLGIHSGVICILLHSAALRMLFTRFLLCTDLLYELTACYVPVKSVIIVLVLVDCPWGLIDGHAVSSIIWAENRLFEHHSRKCWPICMKFVRDLCYTEYTCGFSLTPTGAWVAPGR